MDSIVASDTPAVPAIRQDAEIERMRRFWMGMLYAALVGYVASIVAILSYIWWTWAQPGRGLMVVVIGLALLGAAAVFFLRHRLVRSYYCDLIFAGLNAATFLFILALCLLDSGINSPMTYLYILPMLYLGIGLSLTAVLASGIVGLAGCALLIAMNTGPVYGPTNMLQLMALSVGLLLAILGALNRQRQDSVLKTMRTRLETLATTDELSGCLNQRAFMAVVYQEYSRATRYNHDMALLLVDIDHFKDVNDQHGHLMGDSVLRHVGETLRQTARHADIAGRTGGDELALLAPETALDDARVLAQRLCRQIKLHELGVDLSLSVGVCAMDATVHDVKTLFERADQALYMAKQRGRDQVKLSTELYAIKKTPEPA